jgi:hypothetical protein
MIDEGSIRVWFSRAQRSRPDERKFNTEALAEDGAHVRSHRRASRDRGRRHAT